MTCTMRATSGSRLSGRRVIAISCIVLPVLILDLVAASSWAATSCIVRRPGQELPSHVQEAWQKFADYEPQVPGGWELKAERATENRKQIAGGRMSKAQAASQGGAVVAGTLNVPVLLTLFQDTASEPYAFADLQLGLFGPSVNPTMSDYYVEVSYDNLHVEGQVYDWVEVSQPRFSYAGLNNGLGSNGALLVLEAALGNDATIDFGQYDNDGPDNIPNSGDDDGYVDILAVIHPDQGAECLGEWAPFIWSHHSYLSNSGFSGISTNDPAAGGGNIRIDRFILVPALNCDSGGGGMIDIGVICHEVGHVLGVPDLYDTDKSSIFSGDSAGIGVWGLMGAGNWNSTTSPAHMTAFSKERLGWLTYLDIAADQIQLCLPPVETDPVAARVWKDGNPSSEYFVVENRQVQGFDSSLRGSGLVIYHVNEDVYDAFRGSNRVNAFEQLKAIDVECADASLAGHVVNADDLDDLTNSGDPTDSWCATGGATSFGPNTTPDTRSYSNDPTGVAITNIGDCFSGPAAGWVCADYLVGVASPIDLCIEDCDADACNEIATCANWWATPHIWFDHNEDFILDVPVPRLDNKLFVRYVNLGPDDATAVTINLYAARAAMGLQWPSDADIFLGVAGEPVVPSGKVVTDNIVFEYPELFATEQHWCIGAVINHGFDATLSEATQLSNNLAQINSQVIYERAGTGALRGTCPGPYSADSKIYLLDGHNPERIPLTARVLVGNPPDFDDAVIPAGWTLSIQPTAGPFTLSPGMKDSISVRLSSPSASHGDSAYVPLTLWDTDAGAAIGGTVLDFRVDCYNPLAPLNLLAEWVEVPGDAILGHTVRVEWDPVTLDTQGNPERILYYEVYRSDDQGSPETLIDEVAIDVEPAEPGFQWYDELPRGECPIIYTYRVRALDLAGYTGNYSAPIILNCLQTAVEAPVGSERTLTRSFPNPFAGSTTIAFDLPRAGRVSVEVYNTRGERVRMLARGDRSAGGHEFVWDGNDEDGIRVGSGVYFFRVQGSDISETRKIVLTR